jgi:hypothetical protein
VINPATGQPIAYTGAAVTETVSPPVTMSLLQAGITPTFYQFTEASVEVRMSISLRQTAQTQSNVSSRLNFGIFSSTVDYRSSNTFSFTASGASVFRATLRPVPPPSRVTPRVVTVDATVEPPRVTSVG